MPEPDGRLTDDELATVRDWLSERAPKGGCPVCKHTEFAVAGHLVELRVFRGGDLHVGGPIYPAALASCQKCHHLMLFSATAIGLLPPDEDSGSEPTDG